MINRVMGNQTFKRGAEVVLLRNLHLILQSKEKH